MYKWFSPENIPLYKDRVFAEGDHVLRINDDKSRRKANGAIFKDDVTTPSIILRVNDDKTADLKTYNGTTEQVSLSSLVKLHIGSQTSYPVLHKTDNVEGKGSEGKPVNILINGENLYALQALLYPYENKVDYIYIDPPYNTGSTQWKYNNKYVDSKNDPFGDSKWCSFMEQRLVLAKRLLNSHDSVLCVAIDRKEYIQLGAILTRVFPAEASAGRIQMVSVETNKKGVTDKLGFAKSSEYLFFVRIVDSKFNGTTDVRASSKYWNRDYDGKPPKKDKRKYEGVPLRRQGSNDKREDSKNCFYPVFVRNDNNVIIGSGDPYKPDDLNDHNWDKVGAPEGCHSVWPIKTNGTEGRWQTSTSTFRNNLKNGYVYMTDNGTIKYYHDNVLNAYENGELTMVGKDPVDGHVIFKPNDSITIQLKGLWANKAGHIDSGMTQLKTVLGVTEEPFDFPKPMYLVEDCLHIFLENKKDALVLDFFAGSGTTGQVVGLMNKRDGGHRKCILVTNNENSKAMENKLRRAGVTPIDDEWQSDGICDSVTWPRIKSAVLGRTAHSGYTEPIDGEYKYEGGGPMSDGLAERWEKYDLRFLRNPPTSKSQEADKDDVQNVLMLATGANEEQMLAEKVNDNGKTLWRIYPSFSVIYDSWQRGSYVRKMKELYNDGKLATKHESNSYIGTSMLKDDLSEITGIKLIDQSSTSAKSYKRRMDYYLDKIIRDVPSIMNTR